MVLRGCGAAALAAWAVQGTTAGPARTMVWKVLRSRVPWLQRHKGKPLAVTDFAAHALRAGKNNLAWFRACVVLG